MRLFFPCQLTLYVTRIAGDCALNAAENGLNCLKITHIRALMRGGRA
jgi:hypothetical protein